jgi:hypothetical protein
VRDAPSPDEKAAAAHALHPLFIVLAIADDPIRAFAGDGWAAATRARNAWKLPYFLSGFPCLMTDLVSGCAARQDNQDEARERPDHQSRDVQGGHLANVSECDEVGSHS